VHERVKGRKLSGIMLLTRDAYSAIAGLAATTLALGVVSGMARLALPTDAIGLWATAFVRQVATVAEARSAREELDSFDGEDGCR
jgi:hypothetical protein